MKKIGRCGLINAGLSHKKVGVRKQTLFKLF